MTIAPFERPTALPFDEAEPQPVALESVAPADQLLSPITDYQIAAAGQLSTETQLVSNILSVVQNLNDTAAPVDEQVANVDPAETLQAITRQLEVGEAADIPAITAVLAKTVDETRQVRSWLSGHTEEADGLAAVRDQRRSEAAEVSVQAQAQAERSLITRAFHARQRRRLGTRQQELDEQGSQLDGQLTSRQQQTEQVAEQLAKLTTVQENLAFRAVRTLFGEVVSNYETLGTMLSDQPIKVRLNEELITERVIPELTAISEKTDGQFTPELQAEYLDILRTMLREGSSPDFSSPNYEDAVAQRERLNELAAIAPYNALSDLGRQVTAAGDNWRRPADGYYDAIIGVVTRQAAKQEVERLQANLSEKLNPAMQGLVSEAATRTIQPDSWLSREQHNLEAANMSYSDFDRLGGLERWPVVKRFITDHGVLPGAAIQASEAGIVHSLYARKLFPGGRESWEGTEAVHQIELIDSPTAVPLLLHQVQTYGSGHTNASAVRVMAGLMESAQPDELDHVLQELPDNTRRLLQTLANPESYMNRFGAESQQDEYLKAYLLEHGEQTLAQEALTGILEAIGVEDSKLRDFYVGYSGEEPDMVDALLQRRDQVEAVIIAAPYVHWADTNDKLLAALVNPRRGDSAAFPIRIASEGLDASEATLAKLSDMLASKAMLKSGFEKETCLDGLLLLNSKANGHEVLETLMDAYQGSREDPKRVRRIFQLLQTLDGFDAYAFVEPDPAEAVQINAAMQTVEAELVVLEANAHLSDADKAHRRELKNQLETLGYSLQDITGLKGYEAALAQRVVDIASERLELGDEHKEKLRANLNNLMQSGLFDIIPTLAATYERKGVTAPHNLLKVVTAHIIDGDFQHWRYNHELSAEQLAGLSDEQKLFWQENLAPLTLDIQAAETEQQRQADALGALQRIINNAKEHIIQAESGFEVSADLAGSLQQQLAELASNIQQTTDDSELQQLSESKRLLEAQLSVVENILEIEGLSADDFSQAQAKQYAELLRAKLNELGLADAQLDVEQIAGIFSVGDLQRLIAKESDDSLALLKVGVQPQETCQSWRQGGYNQCLLAYVADSNKKIVNIEDEQGNLIARSVVKFTRQRELSASDDTAQPTIFVEKPYSLSASPAVNQALIRLMLAKAKGLGTALTFSRGFDEEELTLFRIEAERIGYGLEEKSLAVFLPRSLNATEYSDSLGGEISYFDRYQEVGAVTFTAQA